MIKTGKVGHAYMLWYNVSDIPDVRRFVRQKQPAMHEGYTEIANKWQVMLDNDIADLEEYLEVGRNRYWH